MRKRNVVLAGVGIFVGLGVLGSALGSSPSTTATTSTTPSTDNGAVAAAPSAATAAPSAAATPTVKKGEPVDVGGARVTILDAQYADKVGQFQKPAAGYLYFAMKVRYEATDGETLVSSNDWNVLADGKKQGHWTIVVNDKWDPSLPFDTLTAGATTEGWITFEVPKATDSFRVQFDNKFFSDEPQFVSNFKVS